MMVAGGFLSHKVRQMTDAKPLQSLNLKTGDVVECVKNGSASSNWTKGKRYTASELNRRPACCNDAGVMNDISISTFRIVSRADDGWGPWVLDFPGMATSARFEIHILPGGQKVYRVKREPVVTKAVAYCSVGSTITPLQCLGDTHRVTVTYRDGADPAVTVEKL
jgi:hypothetical protein